MTRQQVPSAEVPRVSLKRTMQYAVLPGASKGNPVKRSRLEHLAYEPAVSFQTSWPQLLNAATVLQSEACADCKES